MPEWRLCRGGKLDEMEQRKASEVSEIGNGCRWSRNEPLQSMVGFPGALNVLLRTEEEARL